LKANRLTDKDTLVLTDFTNTTGDALFDDTLKQGLSVQLRQSPFLELISDRRVNDTLKLMGRAAGDRLTPELAREVCVRTGSKAILAGSISGLGNQYVIGLKAVNCDTGDVLAEAQEQAADKEAVLKALDAATVSMRSRLGESHGSVQAYVTPLIEATTPSLEALKAYSLGLKTQATQGDMAALPFFKRAAERDPNFALVYSSLTSAYGNMNELDLAAQYARKAYALRERVSERERFPIEIDYYMVATEELEKAAQICEQWQRTHPRDYEPYANLSYIFAALGNHEKALQEAREFVRLEPNDVIGYNNLGSAYTNLNQLNEAEEVGNQANARQLESEGLLLNRYELAFLKNDTAQMTQVAAAAMGQAGAEDLLLAAQADTEAWHGKLKNARELTQGAIESAERNDANETAASYQAAAALREVESGNWKQARRDVDAAMKLAPNRNVRIFTALVLARVGDRAAAEKIAADLDKTFPLDTLVQRYWLPCIRAAVALQTKDPHRALELLKTASAIEFSQPAQVNVILCPAYLRGAAYLLLHDGNVAAAEFQKFVDHRGLVGNFPWGALARLGLARAYVLQGDTVSARAAYQDFLMLWKDADPDITILKQAKAEYEKLE
jgi:tetratricopeptide (TPR) repeat protein